MKRTRRIIMCTGLAIFAIMMTGCPDGSGLLTFDLYVINGTSNLTIGLVGLDNGQGKALVDILDENIPAGAMKKLVVSLPTYGTDNGSVQIGIVDVGFSSVNNIALGPDPTVILVEGNSNAVTVRALDYQ